jgi:hypothetical protein
MARRLAEKYRPANSRPPRELHLFEDIVELPVRIIGETAKAYLLTMDQAGAGQQAWEPKAMVTIEEHNENPAMKTAIMDRDYAKKKGWI